MLNVKRYLVRGEPQKIVSPQIGRGGEHQISFHMKHKKNTYVLVACSPELGHFRLYPGSRILELVDLGLKLEPLACGLDSCALLLEGL